MTFKFLKLVCKQNVIGYYSPNPTLILITWRLRWHIQRGNEFCKFQRVSNFKALLCKAALRCSCYCWYMSLITEELSIMKCHHETFIEWYVICICLKWLGDIPVLLTEKYWSWYINIPFATTAHMFHVAVNVYKIVTKACTLTKIKDTYKLFVSNNSFRLRYTFTFKIIS